MVDEHGIICHTNVHLADLSAYSSEELVGIALPALLSPVESEWTQIGDPLELAGTDKRVSRGPSSNCAVEERPWILRRRDGTTCQVAVSTTRTSLEDRAWTIVEIRDVSERIALEHELGRQAQQFRLAFENNMAPMSIAGPDDRIVAVNQAFLQMVGYSEDEVRDGDTKLFTHPDDVGISEESLRKVREEGVDQQRYLKRYRPKVGGVINVEISRSAARDANGDVAFFIFSGLDITDRVSRQGFLELLAAVNSMTLRANDEHELLDQLCEVLVEVGGYRLAWVGVTSQSDEEVLDIYSRAGVQGYLYEGMVCASEKSPRGKGPAGIAVRSGQPQVSNDLSATDNYEIWSERAKEHGLASSLALPFTLGTRSAVLSLYSADSMGFGEMTVKGLVDLVHEVQLALSRLHSLEATRSALARTTEAARALRAAEDALIGSEQRFRLAFEDNMSPMIFNDLDDLTIAANDAFCEMVGFSREELMGHDSKMFTHPDDVGITEKTHRRLVAGEIQQARYVKRYRRKDGCVVISEVSRSAARGPEGNILYFVASERDITEERALTEQLSRQALHDPLTGLPNRTFFEDRLTHAFARSARTGQTGAVILMDLDDFKGVNDSHGHAAGDQLLSLIAHRLTKMTRAADTLGRFGGDEFLYLAEELDSPEQATLIAERILGAMSQKFEVDGQDFHQHASVGIFTWDGTETSCTDFLQNADVAMYQAKRQGKGSIAVFTKEMRACVTEEYELVQELRVALDADVLEMHYQPIVRLDTLEIAGFEALMRWRHPRRGMVPPDVFIALAERSDLILQLGSFALDRALSTAATWQPRAGHSIPPFVSVNLSARQFQDPLLVEKVESALHEYGVSAQRLIIEITESVTLLDVAETSLVVRRLNALGVNFALDDFGTGYSSLSYLAELSPRIIKIDKTFVNPSLHSDRNDTLLETIVSLGHQLEGTMLGEGIETYGQLERLRDLQCELGQGYLFSPAVPPDEVDALIEQLPWSSLTR